MDKRIKIIAVILAAGCFAGTAKAEFGISLGGSFNYEASFESAPVVLPRANDPGDAVSGTDHFYDDGYNLVDSTGNADRGTGTTLTTYWGYQDAAQDNGSRITMSSTQYTVDAASSSASEDGVPAVEIYWQGELVGNKRLSLGLRTALRWQQVSLKDRIVHSSAAETISDSYSYVGSPPEAPFDGSYAGPNFLLSDIPSRSISTAPLISSCELEADLVGFYVGPVLSWHCSEKLNAVFSVGNILTRIDSDFSYADGSLSSGSGSDSDWLPGFYASADLQYKVDERWGLFCGAVYTMQDDFVQEVDGHSAALTLDDSYTLRAGLFFQ